MTGFSIIIVSIINVWGSTCWTCHGSTIQTRFFWGLWKYVCKCKYVVSTQLVAWQKETSRICTTMSFGGAVVFPLLVPLWSMANGEMGFTCTYPYT